MDIVKKTQILVGAVVLCFGMGVGSVNAAAGFSGFIQDSGDPDYYSGAFSNPSILGSIGSHFIDHIAISFPDFGTVYNGDSDVIVGMRSGLNTITLDQFELYDITLGSTAASGITGGSVSDFTFTTIASHSYELRVGGTKDKAGASYAGNISVSPVPEPETYAMLLAGLGLVGFSARRRKVA
jgi:hypothetical protein